VSDRARESFGRLAHPGRLFAEWRSDRSGAAAVQFVAVLPVFIFIVLGLMALFQLYSAQQTLCEAVDKAQRYLQVEGPQFDPAVSPYPDGWVPVAVEIINSELKSNAMTPMQVDAGNVQFFPPDARQYPVDQGEVEFSVPNAWFHLRATTEVSGSLGTLAWLFDPDRAGGVSITCQSTGFYEGPPLGPTIKPDPGQPPVNCPPIPPKCPPGGPTATPVCPPDCPTPDPCPCDP
jgi:hypothetical protein